MSYTGIDACGVGRSGVSETARETYYDEAGTVEWMNVHKADNGILPMFCAWLDCECGRRHRHIH